MIRMMLIGYCLGIRSDRLLCEEVKLNLAYRWFCKLKISDPVPDHSTFSKNRNGRFRESDALRFVFEQVLRRCMDEGLIGGEGFAPAYRRTRRQRKWVEILFAHMKRILKVDRLRLRGLSGARDEFLLTATAQNLRRMAKYLGTDPPGIPQMAVT